MSYRIKRSLRARQARLEMRPETGLTVVIPRSYNKGSVPGLIRSKKAWVLRNLARYEQAPSRPSRSEIRAGDTVPYLGRQLTVATGPGRDGYVAVRLDGDRLVVNLCNGENLGAVLEQWYRLQAAELLAEKSGRWCARLGLGYNRLTIRGQKTRWASCSFKGNLSFNWKLLMAPECVIDYVVIHELTHIKEMNHSHTFWRLVGEQCPDWREMRRWLKVHEAELAAGLTARTG